MNNNLMILMPLLSSGHIKFDIFNSKRVDPQCLRFSCSNLELKLIILERDWDGGWGGGWGGGRDFTNVYTIIFYLPGLIISPGCDVMTICLLSNISIVLWKPQSASTSSISCQEKIIKNTCSHLFNKALIQRCAKKLSRTVSFIFCESKKVMLIRLPC